MNKTNKKLLAALLAFALFAVCAGTLAAESAPAEFDLNATGSITVILHDDTPEHNPIPGSKLTLYKAGEAYIENANLCFALTPDFAESGIDLSDLSAEGLAQSLFEYAKANNIAGRTEQSDENGEIVFADLTVGLYLLAQNEGDTAEGYFPVDPFLVQLPMTNPDGTGWLYDIIAEPKVPLLPPPPIEYTDLTVLKVWEDDDDPARPVSVTVQLFCDGEPYGEPVTLNAEAENNWSHTWENLEKNHSWTVEETPVPTNYKVTYEYSEVDNKVLITVINTKKLIQTGQLNWPVPVLICAGVLVFMLGCVLKLSHKRKAEK